LGDKEPKATKFRAAEGVDKEPKATKFRAAEGGERHDFCNSQLVQFFN
jgi:hypothetical protein